MNENTEPKALMGRVTALEIIARMAYRRDLSPDDVTALQMGARAILKHHFQHERNRKRHREALAAPPEAAPTRVAPSGGAASSRAPEAMAERVRAVAARMRQLEKKATAEGLSMGPGALMLWLEDFASRLDQAVGDDPTPWTPYEGELEIVRIPKAAPSPSCRSVAVRPAAPEPPAPARSPGGAGGPPAGEGDLPVEITVNVPVSALREVLESKSPEA